MSFQAGNTPSLILLGWVSEMNLPSVLYTAREAAHCKTGNHKALFLGSLKRTSGHGTGSMPAPETLPPTQVRTAQLTF